MGYFIKILIIHLFFPNAKMEKNILAHSGMGQDNKIAMFVVFVLLWLAQLVVYESGSRVLTSTAEEEVFISLQLVITIRHIVYWGTSPSVQGVPFISSDTLYRVSHLYNRTYRTGRPISQSFSYFGVLGSGAHIVEKLLAIFQQPSR